MRNSNGDLQPRGGRKWLRFVAGCGAGAVAAALLSGWLTPTSSHAAELPSICFEDRADAAGVHFVLNNSASGEKHQIETMAGGVAVFDYNGDGRPDLYFINGAKLPEMDKSDPRFWNRLYRNDGHGRFTDVTEAAGMKGAGYGMGVAAADYDNDGHEDVFIAGVNRNQLFHNNGDGTFTDVTAKAGLAGMLAGYGKPFSVGAGWFDYNNDGLLDLFVVNYVRWSLIGEPACKSGEIRAYCSPNSYAGMPNMLFRNNGDGTFTDVSQASGIGKVTGKGMGVAFADYDGDGYQDVFVANDTFRNLLFHNKGDGTFEEIGIVAGIAYNENGKSIAGMGACFRDVDNDGKPDIFVTGMNGDTFPLFHNAGSYFTDITAKSGVAAATQRMTGWGNGVFDFDNDGWPDLFTANAAILDNSEQVDNLPYRLPNLVLRNEGDGHFRNVSAGALWAKAAAHRGAAFGDLDGDGRIDAVTTVLNGPAEILMNRSPNSNHWILLDLQGSKSNRDGIGAKVCVRTGKRIQYNHASSSVGYASSSIPLVHFGLEKAARIDEIAILWPDGRKQTLTQIPADQVLRVREK